MATKCKKGCRGCRRDGMGNEENYWMKGGVDKRMLQGNAWWLSSLNYCGNLTPLTLRETIWVRWPSWDKFNISLNPVFSSKFDTAMRPENAVGSISGWLNYEVCLLSSILYKILRPNKAVWAHEVNFPLKTTVRIDNPRKIALISTTYPSMKYSPQVMW